MQKAFIKCVLSFPRVSVCHHGFTSLICCVWYKPDSRYIVLKRKCNPCKKLLNYFPMGEQCGWGRGGEVEVRGVSGVNLQAPSPFVFF